MSAMHNQVSLISQECAQHALDSEASAGDLANSAERIAALLSRFKM